VAQMEYSGLRIDKPAWWLGSTCGSCGNAELVRHK
jgi:hypothetical protein